MPAVATTRSCFARRRLAGRPVGVQRRGLGARDRRIEGAGSLRHRPRDRLLAQRFRRRPARSTPSAAAELLVARCRDPVRAPAGPVSATARPGGERAAPAHAARMRLVAPAGPPVARLEVFAQRARQAQGGWRTRCSAGWNANTRRCATPTRSCAPPIRNAGCNWRALEWLRGRPGDPRATPATGRPAPARAGALAACGQPLGHGRARLQHPPARRWPHRARYRRRRRRRHCTAACTMAGCACTSKARSPA